MGQTQRFSLSPPGPVDQWMLSTGCGLPSDPGVQAMAPQGLSLGPRSPGMAWPLRVDLF